MSTSQLFKAVGAAALARFDIVMDWLGLAGGRNAGREYLPLNPKRDDHAPGSLTEFILRVDLFSVNYSGLFFQLPRNVFVLLCGNISGPSERSIWKHWL